MNPNKVQDIQQLWNIQMFLKSVYKTEGIWILTSCGLSSTEGEVMGPLPLNDVPNTLQSSNWPTCIFRPQFFTLSLDFGAKDRLAA